jgi:hypothetical protein
VVAAVLAHGWLVDWLVWSGGAWKGELGCVCVWPFGSGFYIIISRGIRDW